MKHIAEQFLLKFPPEEPVNHGKPKERTNKMQAILTFSFEKVTKNTVRYIEDNVAEGARPVVGVLYVNKELAGDAKSLAVTIESV